MCNRIQRAWRGYFYRQYRLPTQNQIRSLPTTRTSSETYSSSPYSFTRISDYELKTKLFTNGMSYYDFAKKNNGVFCRDGSGNTVYAGIDSNGNYVKKVLLGNKRLASDWKTFDIAYGNNASLMNNSIKQIEMEKFISDRGLIKGANGKWYRTDCRTGAYSFNLKGSNFIANWEGGEINGKKYPPLIFIKSKWSEASTYYDEDIPPPPPPLPPDSNITTDQTTSNLGLITQRTTLPPPPTIED